MNQVRQKRQSWRAVRGGDEDTRMGGVLSHCSQVKFGCFTKCEVAEGKNSEKEERER